MFHLNCFTCLVCRKQLSTGEELYVLDDNKFICKNDYLNGNKTAAITGHHQGKFSSFLLVKKKKTNTFITHQKKKEKRVHAPPLLHINNRTRGNDIHTTRLDTTIMWEESHVLPPICTLYKLPAIQLQ